MKRTFEAWQDSDGLSMTFAPRDSIQELRDKNLLAHNATLLLSVDADSYEEAMAIYHLRMGWAPYRPEGESSPVRNAARSCMQVEAASVGGAETRSSSRRPNKRLELAARVAGGMN